MKQLNETQKNLVSSFAKTNKISHAKLDTLVNDLMSAFPVGKHKGRQASAETVALTAKLEEAATTNPQQIFTMKQLAQTLGAKAPDLTNLVKKMAQEGKAFQVGSAPKVAGVRGKVPTLWSFQKPISDSVEVPNE